MPSLSLIATEAQQLLRRQPDARRRAQQTGLAELCESHWLELRGPEPETSLAQALWSVTPPLADLFIDLYATGDMRLDEFLPAGKFAQGMALVVLEEIERGNEAGVHIAHEPMMAFETTPPTATWLQHHTALLHGTLETPLLHHHDTHPPLWKALAVITTQIKRTDLPAVLQVIRLLTTTRDQAAIPHDETLETLRNATLQAGIRFLSIDDDHISLEQHGHEHKPVRARQLAEMLLEIRQMWMR